jgi:H+/Cl- antiporter ClcA
VPGGATASSLPAGLTSDWGPDSLREIGASGPAGDQLARREAIRQIERRRRFWISTAAWTAVMILVAVIWATSEYHNAGGWPTSGFSQSSGIPNVWNYWIIYPLIAWVLGTAASAWYVFGRKPISEDQIKHEMDRQAGQR